MQIKPGDTVVAYLKIEVDEVIENKIYSSVKGWYTARNGSRTYCLIPVEACSAPRNIESPERDGI